MTTAEEEILFSPDDEFTDVTAEWLLPRLRLNPAASPVDLDGGLLLYVDGQEIEVTDLMTIFGSGAHDELLIAYGDGGAVGGRFTIVGSWLRDWAAETRHVITWIGGNPSLRDLAIDCLAAGVGVWEPAFDDRFEIDSPYLSAEDPGDVAVVLRWAADVEVVRLNDQVVG